MPSPEETIRGRNETPDEKAWREFHLKSKQEQINRIEDAAKFLTGLVSVIATILELQKLDKASAEVHPVWVLGGLLLWIASIFLALLVVFPFKHSFREGVILELEPKYQEIAQKKMGRLVASALCFILALSFSLSMTSFTAMYKIKITETTKSSVDTLIISPAKHRYLILLTDSIPNGPPVLSPTKKE